MLEQLKQDVLQANLDLVRHGLVTLTWGNVSGIDRGSGRIVIKPSGVAYEALTPKDMVVVDLQGKTVEGALHPSTDTPAHLCLYNACPLIGGITHTHSPYATMFAQACREIPCLGTTHADLFHGPVPLARFLSEEEVQDNYEANMGRVIVERFQELDWESLPGVLLAGHAPFTWGKSAAEALLHAVALERIAHMAFGTLRLNPESCELPRHILTKHYRRKHGPDAYYGQSKSKPPSIKE
jgi:L-ribulose-5-phosphate 4-epimerase